MDGDNNSNGDTDLNQSNIVTVVNADPVNLSEPNDKRKLEEVLDGNADEAEERHRKKKKKSKDRERKHKDKDRERDEDRERRKKESSVDEKEKERDRSEISKNNESESKTHQKSSESSKKESNDESIDVKKLPSKDSRENRERDRDRDRERDSRGRDDRDRDRDRDSRRDYDYRRRDYRERSRSYGRRGRSRSDSRSRYYAGSSRRSRSNSRGGRSDRDRRKRSESGERRDRRRRDEENHRSSSGNASAAATEKDREKDNKNDKNDSSSSSNSLRPLTLKDVISANPGISMPEAVVRLNAYNSALVKGEIPPPITGQTPLPANAATNTAIAAVNIATAMGAAFGEGGAMTKPHREIYVGNLPPGITMAQITEFLNAAMKQAGLTKQPGVNPVIAAWVSPDGHYAFVEMRTIDEATAALTYLNGVQVGAYNLRIGRPKGYTASATPLGTGIGGLTLPGVAGGGLGLNPLLTAGIGGVNPLLGLGLGINAGLLGGLTAGVGEALSNVIMVSNLPALITEEQVKELFKEFGELKAFNLIKTATGQTQSAVFEYVNPEVTDEVVKGMNKIEIAENRLSVQRVPMSSAALLLKPTNTIGSITSNTVSNTAVATVSTSTTGATNVVEEIEKELKDLSPTTIIRLSNMTTEEDLIDDSLYEELIEDVADECNRHGTVKSIVVPRKPAERPAGSNEVDTSVGKIFVHFTNHEGAQKALSAIAGRKFNGKTVLAAYYPERLFSLKIYTVPSGYSEKALSASNGNNGSGGADLD